MPGPLNNCMLCSGTVFGLGGSKLSWWCCNAGMRSEWHRWAFNICCSGCKGVLPENLGARDSRSMEKIATALKEAVEASEGAHALNFHVDRVTRYRDPDVPWAGDNEVFAAYAVAESHAGIRLGAEPATEPAYHEAAGRLAERWWMNARGPRSGGSPFTLSVTETHGYEPDATVAARGGARPEARPPTANGSFAVFAPHQWTVARASLLGLADAMLESARME